MITLFIFYIHLVGAVALYTKRWQESGWKEGVLAVGFLALIFSVGWSISTFIMKLLVSEKGFGVWMDRDALALMLLLAMEVAFYSFQFAHKKASRSAS